jgi:hypothetical protein
MMNPLPIVTTMLLAAQAPIEPVPDTTAPAPATGEQAPDLLTEPEAAPAPQLYTPLELDGTSTPAPAPPPPPPAPAPTSALPPPKAPRLLVMDIVDQGGAKEMIGAISEAVNAQAIGSHMGEVVTTAQLKVALDASALQAMAGCMSEICMADIAKTVEAERVLGGTVNRVGKDLLITLLLVDPKTGNRIDQKQRKVPMSQDMYFYATKQLTSLLLTGRAVDPLVPVAISASEEGATIVLDGREVGQAPATVKVDPGSHEIRVSKDGFVLWKTTAQVDDATPLSVHADLIATRFPIWPFALSSGVIAVGTAGVATYFALGSMNAYSGFLGDPADSYTGAAQPDSAFLSDKRQQTIERAVWADIFWGTTAVFGVVALGLGAWELASVALSE